MLVFLDNRKPHDVPLFVAELTAQINHGQLSAKLHPKSIDAQDAYVRVVVLNHPQSTFRDM